MHSLMSQVQDRPAALPTLLDVPLMLAPSSSGKQACSLRLEVEQLATGSFEAPQVSSFVSLHQLSGADQPDAAVPPVRPVVTPPSMLAIHPPAATPSEVPGFLLLHDVADNADWKGSAAWNLPRMDAPVLVAADCTCADDRAAFGAPLAAFPDEFRPVPVPVVASDLCFAPLGCTPLSLSELLARDLALDDDGLVLPDVALEDSSCEVESIISLLPLIASECAAKPAGVAHLALYLDWWVLLHAGFLEHQRSPCICFAALCAIVAYFNCRSLSINKCAMRPPDLAAAMKRMRRLSLPASMPCANLSHMLSQHRAALVEQLLAPFQLAVKSNARGRAGNLQLRAASAAAAQARCHPDSEAPAECAPQAAKRTKRGAAGADMSYFLQLHGARVTAGSAAQEGSGVPADAHGPASSSSSGEDAADALELHLRQPSTSVHSVELPSIHSKLLCLLREDERRLVQSAVRPAVAHKVACSDFLSVDVLQQALEQTAGAPIIVWHMQQASAS